MLEKSCKDFLMELSSAAPAPGGGGASAFGGAIGVALGSMVGNLTTGKKKYADVEQEIQRLLLLLEDSQKKLVNLVQADADAFLPLSKAYGMPKNTEEEKEKKAQVMEQALKSACAVPLEIMEECLFALGLLQEMGEKGTRLAISDVAVGAAFLRAAAQGAAVNVFTNTRLMSEKGYAAACEEKAVQMREEAERLADRIYIRIEEELR